MFKFPNDIDESQIVKSLKDFFDKLNQDEIESDDDKFFIVYYFLELSQAIIRDFGDDFSKSLAKVILDTLD